MKTPLIMAAAVLALATPAVTAQTPSTEITDARSAALTVNVKGMVCDFCARAVGKVFGKNDAVREVHVDLDNGEIHVSLNPGMTLSDDEIETLVKKSGYAMISVERDQG